MSKVEFKKRCNCGYNLKLSSIDKLLLRLKGETTITCNNCGCKYKIKMCYHYVVDNCDNSYTMMNKILKEKRDKGYHW